jgi:hypothetical protein
MDSSYNNVSIYSIRSRNRLDYVYIIRYVYSLKKNFSPAEIYKDGAKWG